MSKHTPGPWTVAHGKIVGNGYNIASINGSATSEGKANAALMAAAPDLLEALIVFVEKYDNAKDGPLGVNLVNGDFDNARAAIAKATGQ